MRERAGLRAIGGGRRRWPLWPVFFTLVLAAVSLLLHAEKSRRREEIRQAKEQLAAVVRARPVAGAKSQRAMFHKARFFLDYPAAASFGVADFIRRLAVVFRPREILDLRIDPGLHGFDFQLSVAIAREAPVTMPWQFAACLEELRNFPEIARLSYTEKAPADTSPGEIPRSRGGRDWVFFITGQAELQ